MRIHFIGICGISMKALAELSVKLGNNVSGSDISNSNIEYLISIGINAYVGENPRVLNNIELVVYSSAIKEDNLEMIEARRLGIKVLERSEYLNEISKLCDKTIYIAGSHGKSTTTSIICHSLNKNNYGFIGHCGCDLNNSISNLIYTGRKLLVSEACEYKKNFLKLEPDYLVILNIDYDHPDTYKDLDEVYEAFLLLAKKTKKLVIVHESLKKYFMDNGIYVISFGEKLSSDYYINGYNDFQTGSAFSIYENNIYEGRVFSKLHGVENALNMLATYIILKITKSETISPILCLESFDGVRRRFEKVGEINGASVVVDYAHHPSEIKTVLRVANNLASNLWVVFEPHTYSRTTSLMSEFVSVFCTVSRLILLPSYAARESAPEKDPVKELYGLLDKTKVSLCTSYEEVINKLKNKIAPNDMVLILGAGNVYKLGKLLVNYMDKTVNNAPISYNDYV